MNNTCEICGSSAENITIYKGLIRDGVFDKHIDNAEIFECPDCKVQRLEESKCLSEDTYETGEYRNSLRQNLNVKDAYSVQDVIQKFTFNTLWPTNLRDKSICDVGSGIGSLLDLMRGVSKLQIGIEPCAAYHASLLNRGYPAYSNLSACLIDYTEKVDWVFSIQVIEHVANPVEFLNQMRGLLKKNGRILISTPNRKDILMALLPEYSRFFYRAAHRWYFDEYSLSRCAEIAGLEVSNINYVHRFGMSNTLNWLQHKLPKGDISIDGIEPMADDLWKVYLEQTKQACTIYLELKLPENDK